MPAMAKSVARWLVPQRPSPGTDGDEAEGQGSDEHGWFEQYKQTWTAWSSNHRLALRRTSDSNFTRTYHYSRLKERQIRIVVLLRGSGDDPVRIKIEHWNVDKHDRAYEALSYTWGDETGKRPVFVGKSVCRVTRNLWHFLRRIRLPSTDRYVWADALCIEQDVGKDDNKVREREQQVRYMTYIYPSATKVLVWLGEADETVREAFATLEEWASVYDDHRKLLQLAHTYRQQWPMRERKLVVLTALFSREYFKRAWIVQEILANHDRPPVVMCGPHEIRWNRFHTGFFALTSTLGASFSDVPEGFGESLQALLPLVSLTWAPKDDMSMSMLLRAMKDRKSKLPRDKLFSLFGLAERHGHRCPSPNYIMTTRDVSVEHTRAIITQDKSLMLLSLVNKAPGVDKLPTWAIKLENMTPNASVADYERVHEGLYRASLGWTPILEPGDHATARTLRMRGLPVDRILQIHNMSGVLEYMQKDVRSWSTLLATVSQYCSERLGLPARYLGTCERTSKAFLRTLCTDDSYLCSSSGKHVKGKVADRKRLHVAYMQHMTGLRHDVGETSLGASSNLLSEDELATCVSDAFTLDDSGPQRPPPYRQAFPVRFLEQFVIAELLGFVRWRLKDMSLAVTMGGRLVIAPNDCRIRDEVWVIPGGSVPFVLRPGLLQRRNGCLAVVHQLVGDAYVHGIMQGETMELLQKVADLSSKARATMLLPVLCLV